jgi:hypothetical protein
LALALVQQPWFEPPAGPLYDVMKRELDGYPFRQMPRFVDEVNAKVDIVQSMVSGTEWRRCSRRPLALLELVML